MGKQSTRENKTIYQLCREEKELTREKASELMAGVSSSRIEKIEYETQEPTPYDVVQMADCYKRPDLCNYYCSHKCAIGQRYVPEVEVGDLLFIHDTGAHGFSMGYNYNGKLKSAEVLLKEDGSFEVIRRAETPKDYFATLDGTPEYEKMFGNK